MFDLFKILDYNFSPRFRYLDDQRFWRATMPGVETGTYGAVEDLARNRVNLNKVITRWPDIGGGVRRVRADREPDRCPPRCCSSSRRPP